MISEDFKLTDIIWTSDFDFEGDVIIGKLDIRISNNVIMKDIIVE